MSIVATSTPPRSIFALPQRPSTSTSTSSATPATQAVSTDFKMHIMGRVQELRAEGRGAIDPMDPALFAPLDAAIKNGEATVVPLTANEAAVFPAGVDVEKATSFFLRKTTRCFGPMFSGPHAVGVRAATQSSTPVVCRTPDARPAGSSGPLGAFLQRGDVLSTTEQRKLATQAMKALSTAQLGAPSFLAPDLTGRIAIALPADPMGSDAPQETAYVDVRAGNFILKREGGFVERPEPRYFAPVSL